MFERSWEKRLAGLGLLCTMVGCGEGGVELSEEDRVEESVEALLDGIRTSERPEIGQYFFNGSACTGTLIDPRVVITAKHCVGYGSCDDGTCSNPRSGFVIRGADGREHIYPAQNYRSFNVDGYVPKGGFSWFYFYDIDKEHYSLADDVAIVLLREAVPASVATPVKLADARPADGRSLTIYGYGCTDRTTKDGANVKRKVTFTQGELSNSVCSGDSGGPVLDSETGELYMVNGGHWDKKSDFFGDVVTLREHIDRQLTDWGILEQGEPMEEEDPVVVTPDPMDPTEPSTCRPYETTPPEQGMPLRISLLWPEATDLDLFVLDPAGQTIYYGNRTTPEGAHLLKADCLSGSCPELEDGSDYAEWIEWSGEPPRGEYKIWAVNYNGRAVANYFIQVESDRGNTSFEGVLATRGESSPSWSFNYEDREICD